MKKTEVFFMERTYLRVLGEAHGKECKGKLHDVEQGNSSESSSSIENISEFDVCEKDQNRLDNRSGH